MNVDIHLFKTRHGKWAARICFAAPEGEKMIHIEGFKKRRLLWNAIEVRLKMEGIQ